ncbi:MAG: MarR family transcriptional regulator, partial [Rhodospirillales bacterium]|nr:MarR family transcriptional regulator [Rhodospirillales bacterium]
MLRRTARRLTQAYDQALRPSGLRLTQFSVLANLTRSGGLSITDLAELLAMERTTLTRNLRPLERAG